MSLCHWNGCLYIWLCNETQVSTGERIQSLMVLSNGCNGYFEFPQHLLMDIHLEVKPKIILRDLLRAGEGKSLVPLIKRLSFKLVILPLSFVAAPTL